MSDQCTIYSTAAVDINHVLHFHLRVLLIYTSTNFIQSPNNITKLSSVSKILKIQGNRFSCCILHLPTIQLNQKIPILTNLNFCYQ